MRVFMLIACLLLAPVQLSFAASLEDVASNNQTTEQSTEVSTGEEAGNASGENGDSGVGGLFTATDSDIIAGMTEDTDISDERQGIDAFRQLVNNITAFVVQALMIVLAGGLVVISGLDLLYIVIPPIRMSLSGGQQGQAIAQMGAQPGMGMNSGMGMGMNTGMGMNSGMGMGMNRGMGMGMGMNSGMGMGMQGQQMQGGRCWVSEAALNAVATAQSDATGKTGVALKIWVKNTSVQLVAIPAITVLLLTGVIQKIGFGLGNVIANALANIKF